VREWAENLAWDLLWAAPAAYLINRLWLDEPWPWWLTLALSTAVADSERRRRRALRGGNRATPS
jgi:hypothetical protein